MEVVALLTAMKEMGFEAGHILSLLVMYFMLHSRLIKVVDKKITELFEKLIEAIGDLKTAMKDLEKVHNERIQKIETHIGLKPKEQE